MFNYRMFIITFVLIFVFKCSADNGPTDSSRASWQRAWEYQSNNDEITGFIVSQFDDGLLWFYNSSKISCLDLETKDLEWEIDFSGILDEIEDNYEDKGISILIETEKYLLVFKYYQNVYSMFTYLRFKLNKNDGSIVTSYTVDDDNGINRRRSIIYCDNYLYYDADWHYICKMNIETDIIEWKAEVSSVSCSAFRMEIYEDVLIVKRAEYIYCLDLMDGELIWSKKANLNIHNFIINNSELIYVDVNYETGLLYFYAIDILTGNYLWSQSFTSHLYSFYIHEMRIINESIIYLAMSFDNEKIFCLFDLNNRIPVFEQKIPYIEHQFTASGAEIYEPNFFDNFISRFLKDYTGIDPENSTDTTIPAGLYWRRVNGEIIDDKYFRFTYPYDFNFYGEHMLRDNNLYIFIQLIEISRDNFRIPPDEDKNLLLNINMESGEVISSEELSFDPIIEYNADIYNSHRMMEIIGNSIYYISSDNSIIEYTYSN